MMNNNYEMNEEMMEQVNGGYVDIDIDVPDHEPDGVGVKASKTDLLVWLWYNLV